MPNPFQPQRDPPELARLQHGHLQPPKGDVCRVAIRPVPRPECEYNEHLSPRIVYGLALTYHTGTQDAARRYGQWSETHMPYMTIQDLMIPGGQHHD